MKTIKNALFALGLFSGGLLAQDEGPLQVFEAPVPIDRPAPSFPASEANRGREGWVVINYMVDTEGKIFEPSIVASTGSKQFERAALRALNDSKFKPANYKGTPVEGSGYIRYTFSLEDSNYASQMFASKYKSLVAAIEEDDKGAADTIIEGLGESSLNHYERAYLDFSRSLYAAKYGTQIEQMQYLNNALQYESYDNSGQEYLPKELIQSARAQLFALEVENKYYAEALRTYALLKSQYGEEQFEMFKPAVEQINELRDSETAYAIDSSLDENGFFAISLFKRGFYLDNTDADLSEFKLRCDKKFVFFAYEPGKQYQIPESWGWCSLQVLGAANGGFQLVQF